MEPLRGTNKATYCVKLLPTTVSAYQVDCGCFCALLRTHCCCVSPCGWYNPPSDSHPPPTPTPPPPAHPPPINFIRDITAVGKNHLKNQHCQLGGRISYETIATYIGSLLILQVWRGYTVALVNHSGFNISNWYFSKYKMCP